MEPTDDPQVKAALEYVNRAFEEYLKLPPETQQNFATHVNALFSLMAADTLAEIQTGLESLNDSTAKMVNSSKELVRSTNDLVGSSKEMVHLTTWVRSLTAALVAVTCALVALGIVTYYLH